MTDAKAGDISYKNEETTKMTEEKIAVEITESFNDPVTQTHFAPAVWELPKSMALRLISEGKAVKTNVKLNADEDKTTNTDTNANMAAVNDPNVPPENDLTDAEKAAANSTGVSTFTELPENTPARSDLIAQGIDSLEKLQAMSREALLDLDKIGDATATKIGLFLSELNKPV